MLKTGKSFVTWYEQNKRALPWRDTNDPYSIWISEIILQQTRVNQGIRYYYNFIKQFPDIHTLANAPIEEVLKVCQFPRITQIKRGWRIYCGSYCFNGF
jgi:A/G-specific adenine glycosylase